MQNLSAKKQLVYAGIEMKNILGKRDAGYKEQQGRADPGV